MVGGATGGTLLAARGAALADDTTTSLRSREAIAFDTIAQMIAAMISVAASTKCFPQFIVGVTVLRTRMLQNQSCRRSTIIECPSRRTAPPA